VRVTNTIASSRRPSDSAIARVLGTVTLCAATVALARQMRRVGRGAAREEAVALPPGRLPELAPHTLGALCTTSTLAFAPRSLHGAAALLAGAVLADSAVQHYRGGFENPGMITPLVTSLATMLAGALGSATRTGRSAGLHAGVYVTAIGAGMVGSGFHVYNVLRRPGGINWGNLFYAAPLGAPAALSLAGLFGLAAHHIPAIPGPTAPRLYGWPAGRVVSALTGIGLGGTASEVALLHFRGAFHNPFMWLPVTVPPVAAALMGTAASSPESAKPRRFTRAWLTLTGLLGIGGIGFHVYGVHRQMGGWRNWSQNILSGPPLSAPPSFTALALAGFAALDLLDRTGSKPKAKP
jgi:hypothetical protein